MELNEWKTLVLDHSGPRAAPGGKRKTPDKGALESAPSRPGAVLDTGSEAVHQTKLLPLCCFLSGGLGGHGGGGARTLNKNLQETATVAALEESKSREGF